METLPLARRELIIDGSTEMTYDFNFMIVVTDGNFLCGGSLLDSTTVLTGEPGGGGVVVWCGGGGWGVA